MPISRHCTKPTRRDLHISFDNYHSTHSPENQDWSETIFKRLEANDHIAIRSVVQAYDEAKELFLADRFIKGTCPKCKTPDQYGSNCGPAAPPIHQLT